MVAKATHGAPSMRELFIEELADIRGGSDNRNPLRDPCCTTMACCEEGPFDGCCSVVPDLGP